jgi:glutamine amidotransferase
MDEKIVILDYGMGNVGSIQNMLKHIGFNALISRKMEDIKNADKLILSGIGAFDSGMHNLSNMGFLEALNVRVLQNKTPVMGICLGMQLFSQASEEGKSAGLGWIDAVTVKFSFSGQSTPLKVPHMGWNTLNITKHHPLLADMPEDMRFYFVHSYHVQCRDEGDSIATTCHGYDFTSVVAKENICGVQFHPEKSHKFGMKLLHNFMNLR